MDFAYTPEQVQVRELTERLCADFDDAYWLKQDQEAAFPHTFYRSVASFRLSPCFGYLSIIR
jgi:acyl-CoA dehydrogenase